MSSQFTKISKRTRTNDLNRLKGRVVSIAKFQDPNLQNKANRGWHSLETAEHLIPIRLLKKFKDDPKECVSSLTEDHVR